MPEIHALAKARLRDAWPGEARDFTPWLAANIHVLADKLGLELEEAQIEQTLPGAGRVDILAKQAVTGATVVIENQLARSDDDHCLRLLGYAANAESDIVVWVARAFSSYHLSILKWLNRADTIDVYAVIPRAYRTGNAFAVDFRTVVEPVRHELEPSVATKRGTSTIYAEFYRPLVARLRREGVQPVGRGGWRGRWRSFQTEYPGAVLATGFGPGGPQVYLTLHGTTREQWHRALQQRQGAIVKRLESDLSWHEGEDIIWLTLDMGRMIDVLESEEHWEATREWMAKSLVSLRDALKSHLDAICATGPQSGT